MKDNETVSLCRKCGRPVCVIEARAYRKILVDADPHYIVPDAEGEIYVRIDGSKMRGREADYEGNETAYPAYRMHRETCGVDE